MSAIIGKIGWIDMTVDNAQRTRDRCFVTIEADVMHASSIR